MAKEKRRMPVKTVTVDLSEEGYPGFTCERRINLARAFFKELFSPEDEDHARRLLLKLFPKWDLVDDEGESIPHTLDGFDLIPDDLLRAMQKRGFEAAREAAMPANLENGSSAETVPAEETPAGGRDIPDGQNES